MIINTTDLEGYCNFLNEIENTLEFYNISKRKLANESDISPATFNRKLENKSFTLLEFLNITKALNRLAS